MSTALTIHTPESRAVAAPAAPDMSFQDMLQMGDQLVSTGFLPAHLRNGAQVAAVILTGRELGMPPMRAIRSLSLVKGKVVESADSQLARFKAQGGRATFTALTEEGATLALRHPNGDEHVESFTMADAKAAGLASNDNYKKFPKAMLRSRVITAGLKSLGWEGSVGAYDPDEAASFTDWTPPQVEPAPSQKWTAPRPEPSAVVEEEPKPLEPLSLREAMDTIGPPAFGGKPMGDTSLSQLRAMVKWSATKTDLSPAALRIVDGARLIIAHREAEAKAAEAAVAVGAETQSVADALTSAVADDESGLPF